MAMQHEAIRFQQEYAEFDSFNHVFSVAQQENLTCAVRVDGGGKYGILQLNHGVLVGAALDDLTGDRAAFAMLGWQQPQLTVATEPCNIPTTIAPDTSTLIMEAAQLQDDWVACEEILPVSRETYAGTQLRRNVIDEIADWDARQTPIELLEAFSLADLAEEPETGATEAIAHAVVESILESIMTFDGATGAMIVDWQRGTTLGVVGTIPACDVVVAANITVVRAKQQVIAALGGSERVEDMLISLDHQYHLLRFIESMPSIFLYVVLDRKDGNLGMARLRLQELEHEL